MAEPINDRYPTLTTPMFKRHRPGVMLANYVGYNQAWTDGDKENATALKKLRLNEEPEAGGKPMLMTLPSDTTSYEEISSTDRIHESQQFTAQLLRNLDQILDYLCLFLLVAAVLEWSRGLIDDRNPPSQASIATCR